MNTGTPRFLEIAQMTGMASTDWTWAVKILDLDNDGWNDVFFSNGMTRSFFHADLRAEVRALKEQTGENRWGDYQPMRERNRAFSNRGGFVFEDTGPAWGLDHEGVSFGAAAGDLDGDGDLDLVVNDFGEAAGLYRNGSVRGNLVTIALLAGGRNRQGLGAELRLRADGVAGEQVRVMTPVRGFMGCDAPEAHFGLGESTVVNSLRIRWPSGRERELRDLGVNRRYTIAEDADGGDTAARVPERNEVPATLFIPLLAPARHEEAAFDDFATQPLLPNRLSRLGPAMVWADIEGDGDIDCFLGGAAGEAAELWVQAEGGNLLGLTVAAFEKDRGHEDLDAVFFDADGDGDLDLYVASGGVEADAAGLLLRDRLYLNEGATFRSAPDGTLPDIRASTGCVAATDFDGDGDTDIVAGARVTPHAYPRSSGGFVLRNEAGRFADVTATVAPDLAAAGMMTDVLWADVDGDGDPDLLATIEYGPVRLFRNDGGRLVEATRAAGLADRLGWWNVIAAADVDGDGDVDFAGGNFGWNTKYHPSPESPQILYSGDFDGSGRAHIIEAHPADGSLIPVRGRSCSSDAMPFIREKFRSFHDYAMATLPEIYTQPKLDTAIRREANDLSSGVLVNDGSGKFEFRALPRLAQIAPCFGLAFLDADGDAHPDLYVSQNFHGPQRETGRMAGGVGLLLLGNGDGTFVEVWPAASGILLPDDARGAQRIDLNRDGLDDVGVAVNDGPMRIFLQRPRTRRAE